MIIPSISFGVIASSRPKFFVESGGSKPRIFVFNLFWDTETIVNRYDTESTTTETTARGWFFR